jgi:hypothetical protein
MPENSDSLLWSEVESYKYLKHTPSTGINLHSWSLDPIDSQPRGSANLSKIDEFKGLFYVHPLISNKYPATIVTMIMNMNSVRYLSGMGAKTWKYASKKIE